MPKMFFVNDKSGNKYEVLGMDKEAGTITLKGQYGSGFTEKYSRERFEKMGYKLVQEDVE